MTKAEREKKKKEQIFALYDAIIPHVEITCSNCKKTETVNGCDEHDGVDYFYESGWRMTKNQNCYCPACAKKKLKNP